MREELYSGLGEAEGAGERVGREVLLGRGEADWVGVGEALKVLFTVLRDEALGRLEAEEEAQMVAVEEGKTLGDGEEDADEE